MSKINRTVALLLSAVFMFNSVNYDVVVKAITENVQEYMEEKKAEEQQKEDEETKEVTTSAETTEVTETVETLEPFEEITTIAEVSKESDDIVTTTESVIVLNGDTEIDSEQKTEYTQDTIINGNLTIKSGHELSLKSGVKLNVNGNFIVESTALFTVSESDVEVIVNGNLIVDGRFHFSESEITVTGNIIEGKNGTEIQGNGRVCLTGDKQQTIDVHSCIRNLINNNTSDKPLYFTNSLNFGRYVDNGKGIITYAKDESGNITDKAGTVTVKNDIKFFCSESQSDNKELVIHGNLCVDKGYVEIIDVSSNNSNKVLLKIEGDFIQQDGEFVTKGQKMEVDGNYNLNGGKYQIMDNGSVLNVGKNLTIQNKSEFFMEHSGTEINVDGNFTVKNTNQNRFKDGIINIKGDFIQEGPGENFKTYGEADKNCNHLVHMVGDKKQKISFENPTTLNADKSVNERQAQFATLKLEHYYDEYDFGDFNPETQRIYENLEPPANGFQKNNGEPYRIRRSMKTPLSHLELVTSGGYIYAIGGVDRENEVSGDISRYDFEDNTWVQTNELNTRRMDFASAVNDKTIYVLGGYDGTEIINNVEVISEETGVKTIESENVLIKRKSHEAVYYNGKIYIMGGEDADGNILSTVEVYDPVTNTAETIASMGTERKNFGATLYIDGTKAYLAVAGGENNKGILDSVEFLDLTVQGAKWETKAELTVPRKGLGLEFLMGKLFAVGGKSENGYLKTVECFTGKSWNKLTNDIDEDITTSKERGFFGSAVAYNSIFIAGGENPSVLSDFEQFMPINIPAVRFNGNSKGLNGDFTQEKTDLAFKSPLMNFSLDRLYNTQYKDEKSDFLGFGWKFNFESSLRVMTNKVGNVTASYLNVRDNPWGTIVGGLEKGTAVEITGETTDSNNSKWLQIANKYYIASWYVDTTVNSAIEVTYPDGTKGYFTQNESGEYKASFGTYDKISLKDNTCELITKEQTKYIYTKSNDTYRNTSITDKYGNTINIDYKSANKVEITNSAGEKITVTKSEDGKSVEVADGYGRKVFYKLNGNQLESVTDTLGLVTSYTYSDKSIVSITENEIKTASVEYDKSGRIFKYTDAQNHISYNYYEDVYIDESNNVLGIAGNLRRLVVDANRHETVTTYSLLEKRPVTTITPDNAVISYEYEIFYNDKYKNVTALKDLDDDYKEILKGQYPTRETMTDANLQKTIVEKDENGNTIKKINPDGSSVTYTYDKNNNLTGEENNANGYITKTLYNYDKEMVYLESVKNGASTETYTYNKSSDIKGLVETKTVKRDDSKNIKTEYTYSKNGELLSEKTGNRITSYGYSYGTYKADKEITVGGEKIIAEKPNNDYEESVFYVNASVNPEGNVIITYYDSMFNPVKITQYDNSGKSTTLSVYDNHGRKIKEVKPEAYVKNPAEADKLSDGCHIYRYNSLGLLESETDDENNTTEYSYDAAGNLKEQILPDNSKYTYEYDSLGRLTSTKLNGTELEKNQYERNLDKESTEAYKQIQTITIDESKKKNVTTAFDYAGRAVRIEEPYRTVENEYYGDGNLKREAAYDGKDFVSEVRYFYNDRGLTETTLTAYEMNKYFITRNIYTDDGLLKYELTYLDAQEVSFEGNSVKLPEKAKASVLNYDYDDAGNVIYEGSYIGEISAADISSVPFAEKTTREYDFKNNTVTEKSGKIKTVYVYNYLNKPVIVKNIVKKADIVSSDSSDGDDTELVTKNTYDRNGNLIKTVTPLGNTTEYKYDGLDRLTETKQHDVPSDDGSKTGILTETLSYNWAGSVTKKVLKFDDSVKSESEYCYDSRNNLILSADKVGDKYAVTAYEYNRAGLLTAEASPESFAGISSEEPLSAETYSIAVASGHTKYTYDDAGRVKTKEFVGKTYTFDKENGSMKANDDSFVISAFEYDANDNLIKEIDGEEYGSDNARGKTYTYSGTGNVLTERYPESDRDNVIYEYDALGNVKEERVLKGTSDAVKYAVTNTSYSQVSDTDCITEYTQEISSSYGEDVSSVVPLPSQKTWKTDINGNVIEETFGKKKVQTEYNSLGLEGKSVTEVDRNDENEAVNSEIKTLYDNEGNAAIIIRSSGIVEINKYDTLRRLVSKTTGKRPEGVADNQLSADKLTDSVTLKWTYDVQGNVRFEYDGNGFKTEYKYDELGRLVNTIKRYGTDNVSEDRMTYNLDGNLTEETTVLNDIQTGKKTYIYDDLGRVIQKSDFDVPYEFIEYNKNSDQIKSFDAEYVLKEFEYNADRQLTKTILAGVCTEELTYDYAGNVYIKKDGEGNSSFYYYDVMDRLVKVSSAGKNDETPAEIASYTYNTEGNIASKTAGSKNKVTYQYTASDEIKETNSNGKTEKFFYNTDGRLSKSVDPAGNETVYTYNAQGLTVKEEVKTEGKVVISKSYTYDKNGNVLKSSVTENGKENVITRTYDELGRVTKKEATDSVTSEFIYDLFTEDNLLCEVTRYDNGESSSNVYDKFGRLKYVYSTDISAGADDSKKTEYTYDNKGRRTSIVYPNGAKSTYEYYDDNNVKVLTNFILNKDAKSDDDKYKEIEKYEYTYYTNNTMSGKTETFDGVEHGKTEYKYDNLLRLVSTKETRNEENYRDITYSYDDSGNRIKEESVEKGVTTTKAYTYGEGNLLLGYTVTTGTEKTDEVKYEYDKNGNLVKEFDIIKNGKTCSDKEKLKTQNTYNALNQLVSSETTEFTITNKYNAEGLRTGKEVKSEGIDTTTKTNYTYEYDKVIFETDSSENYIWNVQDINLISRQINGEMFYCMYNAHADITRMVDENGELAEKYYYDEWGVETETLCYGDITGDGEVNINDYSMMKRLILLNKSELTAEQKIVSDLNADGTVDKDDVNVLKQILFGDMKHCPADTNKDGFINEKNNIKYAGYFYDAETGLYYLNARFYDPETARFIQQDSYSGNILDPLSLNLYTYSRNNPISYYDPSGHLFKEIKSLVSKVINKTKEVVVPVVKAAAVITYKNKIEKPVQTVKKSVEKAQNATAKFIDNYAENWNSGIEQLKSSGTAGERFANFSVGAVEALKSNVAAAQQLIHHPIDTINEMGTNFCEDPLRNNPIAGVVGYLGNVGQAIYQKDLNALSYKIGQGTTNVAIVGVSGAYSKGVANSIAPTLSKVINSGTEQIIAAAGSSMAAALPATAGITAAGSSMAAALPATAGITAAGIATAGAVVGGTMAAGGVVYASKNSGQSSGGGNSSKKNGDTEVILPSKPHKNGTEGHWETILDEVEMMKNSGNYKKIYVNKGLSNEIPGAKPNRRPDIMGVRNDGIIDQVEVPSKTDVPESLIERMMDNQRVLGEKAGSIKIRPINK